MIAFVYINSTFLTPMLFCQMIALCDAGTFSLFLFV